MESGVEVPVEDREDLTVLEPESLRISVIKAADNELLAFSKFPLENLERDPKGNLIGVGHVQVFDPEKVRRCKEQLFFLLGTKICFSLQRGNLLF